MGVTESDTSMMFGTHMVQFELNLAAGEPRTASSWRYRFTKDALVEEYNGRRRVFGLWDRLFGCWKFSADQLRTKEFVPGWEILKESGVWREYAGGHPVPRALLYSGSRARRHQFEAQAAFAAYFSAIPATYRSIVAPMERFQWVALDLIWQVPEFARFLESEMLGGSRQYVFACFALAHVREMSRAERREFAHALMHRKRTDFLYDLTHDRCGKAVLPALSKLGERPLEQWQYKGFVRLMANPKLVRLVGHSKTLPKNLPWHLMGEPAEVLGAKAFQLLIRDPDAARVRRLLAAGLEDFCDLMRSADQDFAGRVKESLRAVSAPPGFSAWCDKWEMRLVEHVQFPAPPFVPVSHLQPIDSFDALRREGRDMRNCVADHVSDVVSGRTYFYRWRGAERATVMIERNEKGGWRVAEILGRNNREVQEQTVERACHFFARAGVLTGGKPEVATRWAPKTGTSLLRRTRVSKQGEN